MNYDFENEKELTLDCIKCLLLNIRDYILNDKPLNKLDILMAETLIEEYRDILINDKESNNIFDNDK